MLVGSCNGNGVQATVHLPLWLYACLGIAHGTAQRCVVLMLCILRSVLCRFRSLAMLLAVGMPTGAFTV